MIRKKSGNRSNFNSSEGGSDMGEEIVYRCPKCLKEHYMSIGAYFRSPAYAGEILAGERGKQAKRNLERHPGKNVMFTYEIFRCSCGYARSKHVMAIYDDNQAPWSMDPERKLVWHNARCRCPRCGKRMKLIREPPRRIRWSMALVMAT